MNNIFINKPEFIPDSDVSSTSESENEENLTNEIINNEKDDSDIDDTDKPVIISIFLLY